MTTIDLPDPALEPVPLQLDRRVTLGAGVNAPDEQRDRISLGRPVSRPLDLATVDQDTLAFLSERPASLFVLLALTCSFRPVEDEPLEKAWLEVTLRTVRPADAEPPTAWSMEPRVMHDPVTVSRKVRLDASLMLTSDVVPVEIGPSVGRETGTEYTQQRPYLEAYREGTARPSWIFTRNKITEIRGVHRLRTVVELPAGATGRAEVSAGATVRHKRWGLITYRAALDPVPESQTVQLG